MSHILLLCEHPSLNGGERSMLSTLEGVCQAGFTVSVVAPPDGALVNALNRRGVPICALPFAAGDSQAKRRERLRLLFNKLRPSLVHANSLSMSRLSGPVAKDLGLPSLGHLRDILRMSRQAIDDLSSHRRLLAVSHATRDWHVGQGVSAEKTCVLYNGVDLTVFRPRPSTGQLRRELGVADDAQLITTIGQIGMRKGVDVFLAAAGAVAERRPEPHFVIVGERNSQKQEAIEFERRLREVAASPPLRGRCCFLGVRSDVPMILRESTALVHAARQEPLGRVLLEAAASGTCVIATDVGGTKEIFPDGAAAALVTPPDDVSALASAMLKILNDNSLRRQLRHNARLRAAERFDVRDAAANLIQHYRWSLDG